MLTTCIPKVRWCLVFSRVEQLKRWWCHLVVVCLSVCVCGVVLFSLEHSKNLKLHAPKVSSRFFKGRYTKTRDNGTTLVPDLLAENFFWNPARAFIPRSVCLSVHPKIYKTLQYLTKPFSTWLNMKQILSPPPPALVGTIKEALAICRSFLDKVVIFFPCIMSRLLFFVARIRLLDKYDLFECLFKGVSSIFQHCFKGASRLFQ